MLILTNVWGSHLVCVCVWVCGGCVGVCVCDFWVREQKRNMWVLARRGECFDTYIVGFLPKECVKNMFKGRTCVSGRREVGST